MDAIVWPAVCQPAQMAGHVSAPNKLANVPPKPRAVPVASAHTKGGGGSDGGAATEEPQVLHVKGHVLATSGYEQ